MKFFSVGIVCKDDWIVRVRVRVRKWVFEIFLQFLFYFRGGLLVS